MHHGGPLIDALILLAAAIVVVPVFHRMKVTPVLGYLAAGLVIGPHGLGLVGTSEDTELLAEFGIIFLLFAIGLEMSLERLRSMRRFLFGVGATQVVLCSILFAAGAIAFGVDLQPALLVGGALALSSTATVLQLLSERGELRGRFGRVAIGVLLFQDLAVVPMLALIPLLAETGEGGLLAALGTAGLKAAAALILIVLVGRLVLRPAYRVIASTRIAELFAATNLLVVLGTGLITATAGMSMALGAFLAGLLLAETEYRHQIEGDIEPFRGLFMGLFFMTVGMGIDLSIAVDQAAGIAVLTLGLMLTKGVIITGLTRAFGLGWDVAVRAGLVLAQCGEFAFVILGMAAALGVIPSDKAAFLMVVVAVTMVLTPLCDDLATRLSQRLSRRHGSRLGSLEEDASHFEGHAIVAGYGRVGRTVARLLDMHQIRYLALDMDVGRIADARRIGLPVYFGDASRLEVLRAAGADRAALVVVTLDQAASAERIVGQLRHSFPGLKVLARGRDGDHASVLRGAGADAVVSETAEPSLILAGEALRVAGADETSVEESLSRMRDDDYAALRDAAAPPSRHG